jgi:F0F1-type ATP synthase membrane subunit b/b'
VSDATYEAIAVYSQVVASVLFIIALVVIWVRFIAPAVVASQARKNAELFESEKRRDAARAEVEAAERERDAADADVRAISSRAAADAARLHDKMLADARLEGERAIRSAEGELERARAAARDRLYDELLERATAIARDAATRLDDGTNRRLVADAVDAAERGGKH